MTVQDAMIESVRPECLALSGLDTREAGPRMQVSQPSRTKAPLLKYQTSKYGKLLNEGKEQAYEGNSFSYVAISREQSRTLLFILDRGRPWSRTLF